MNESVKFMFLIACCTLVRARQISEQRDVVFGILLDGDTGALDGQGEVTCGGTSRASETTFTNPNYPDAEAAALGGCNVRIKHLNENVCQMRLDFDEFTLSQPDNEGVCDVDFLRILGGASHIPSICGDNAGQHMYVDVSADECYFVFSVDTAASDSKWNIRVTQIECNSSDRAPPGCLQYFTSTTGTIASFNFNPASTPTPATRQLANQGYGVCIRSQPGYCSVTYRQTDGSTFSLSGDPTVLSPSIPPPALVGTECTVDYILVPNGFIGDTSNIISGIASADRFCGLSFPTVTNSIPPFNIYVVTDGAEGAAGDFSNDGFKLTYRMSLC